MADDGIPDTWKVAKEHNPYLHNLYVLLNLSPDAGQDEIVQACHDLDQRVAHDQQDKVYGRPLTANDASRGQELAQDADRLIAELLLAHKQHKIDLAPLAALLNQVNRVPIPKPDQILPLAVQDLSFLARLLPDPQEIQPLGPSPLTPEQRRAIFKPLPADEQIYDL